MKVINIETGNDVVCDYCGDDYTTSHATGGILFGTYAVCPKCTPKVIADATRFGESNLIRATCPNGMSYADWVRNELRQQS